MSILSQIFLKLSYQRLKKIEESRNDPFISQLKQFYSLLESGKKTGFGKEHQFNSIETIEQYQQRVPLRDYEGFESYIRRVRSGEKFLLWDTPVKWFAKSSGTSSSKSKFIPVTKESLEHCHYSGMKKMLATYINQNPKSKLFNGNALTLGGSVTNDELGKGKTYCGDLSAILLKNSPFWAETRRVPNQKIALLPGFEQKVEIISKNAYKYNVSSFSGVPSWNLVMLQSILDYTGKKFVGEIWPNLELFMHGGINFEPYKAEFKKIIPHDNMHYMENYNASEGYFAFQDDFSDPSMLLLTENGVFYEFIPVGKLEQALSGSFTAFNTCDNVKTDTNYALVITTNGGLWRYLIGDTISFTSLKPHKFIITGRTQLFINAFGEELMIHNAEKALSMACEKHNVSVANYTVAPLFMSNNSKGSHQWLIEFSGNKPDKNQFKVALDTFLCEINSDYEAKRANNTTMSAPDMVFLKEGVFYSWLKTKGKLGGQNKVPRLYPSRLYADELIALNNGTESIRTAE